MDAINGKDGWIEAFEEWMFLEERVSEPWMRHYAETGKMNALAVAREAALLAALRTESECVHMLHCILEAGDASPGAVRFAHASLQDAERLLSDERDAWRALRALRSVYSPLRGPAWRSDIEADWPHAIEDVAADVHALTAKVLSLQTRVAQR